MILSGHIWTTEMMLCRSILRRWGCTSRAWARHHLSPFPHLPGAKKSGCFENSPKKGLTSLGSCQGQFSYFQMIILLSIFICSKKMAPLGLSETFPPVISCHVWTAEKQVVAGWWPQQLFLVSIEPFPATTASTFPP